MFSYFFKTPVEKISDKKYKHEGQVYRAVEDLWELGVKGDKTAAQGIVDLLSNNVHLNSLSGEVVERAIYLLKLENGMGGSVDALGSLLELERKYHAEELGVTKLEISARGQKPHVTEILDAMVEINPEEAVEEIRKLAYQYHPDEASNALKKVDLPESVDGIYEAAISVDLCDKETHNDGRDIRGLGHMADLYKLVKSGDLKKITEDSVREATEKLSKRLLNVKKLMGFLEDEHEERRVYENAGSAYLGTFETTKKIEALREVFQAVDDSEMFTVELMPMFEEREREFKEWKQKQQGFDKQHSEPLYG